MWGRSKGGTEQSISVQCAFRMHLLSVLGWRRPTSLQDSPTITQEFLKQYKIVYCYSKKVSKNAETKQTEGRMACAQACHFCSCVSSSSNMQIGLYFIYCLLAILSFLFITLTCVAALL